VLERYNLANFLRAIREPRYFLREGKRIARSAYDRLYPPVFRLKHGSGVDVMSRDWENLIILDACRYDVFARQNHLKGDLKRVISRGSSSWEFMEANFVDRSFHDTIYVTANPHTPKLPDGTFYTVVPAYDRWDDKLETVLPGAVTEAATEAHERYPDKRLIVHYMQPHSPHLGPTAEEIRSRLDIKGWDNYLGTEGKSADRVGVATWPAVRAGKISRRELQRAYAESVDIVLKHVEDLLDRIDGRSVVTADHGDFLGEKHATGLGRRYGHPTGVFEREVREVPWFVVDTDERRTVSAEEPIGYEQVDEGTVNERLAALGYKT